MAKGNFDLKGWTFAQFPVAVMLDERLSEGAKVLYAYLAWRQGTNAGCWPSQTKAAEDLGVARETVNRRRRELEAAGWLTVTRREGRANFYTVHAEPVTTESQGCDENDIPTHVKNVTHDESHVDENQEHSVPAEKKNGNHHAMVGALADLTNTDLNIPGMGPAVGKLAKELLIAGYGVSHIAEFKAWWWSEDWRRAPPRLGTVKERIKTALEQRGVSREPLVISLDAPNPPLVIKVS